MKKIFRIILICLVFCIGFLCTSCDTLIVDTTPYPYYPYSYYPHYVRPVPTSAHNDRHFNRPINNHGNKPVQHRNSNNKSNRR
jgi:hypothetical protein